MKARCDECKKWKKCWGIWAHNRWTKDYKDEGYCLANPEDVISRHGRQEACQKFEQVPPKLDKFGPPVDKM